MTTNAVFTIDVAIVAYTAGAATMAILTRRRALKRDRAEWLRAHRERVGGNPVTRLRREA